MPGMHREQLEREPPTGISVLVVGAGIGGLTFAIEAYRKGHDIQVIERSPEGQYSGQSLLIKDENSTATESWSKATTTEKALKVVEQWDPLVKEVIKATPENKVLDWKLMWRNPQPQWASNGGRVVQLGDAAHPFLPTSFSGGTMAMEDAYSLAACLHISGKADVSLATKIHNKLRFERVSCAQKMGFKNREIFHNTNWEKQDQGSKPVNQMVGTWLINHDPEQYAYDNYHSCAQHLLTDAPFENTNSVPGYKYKPWTVKELLDASERGEPLEDEGDWS
ncbi:hypothetical protein N0V95_007054 [Ascochyta clinopodiicola]|nr:hypothetical protein N0V95_007054 [Ascochyta clinopodiicola]